MWEAILGIVSNAVNMFASGNADEGMISTIADQERKNVIPSALKQAMNIYGEQANEGLPGYESLVSEEKTTLPTTLNEMKDAATSGELMGKMTQLYAQRNKGLRDLGVANAQAKLGNKEKLAQFLGGPYANAQNTQLSTSMNLALAKASAMMGKTKQAGDYLSALGKGVGKLGDTDWSSIIAGLSNSQKNTGSALTSPGNTVNSFGSGDVTEYGGDYTPGGSSYDTTQNISSSGTLFHYDPNTGSWNFE